MELSCLCRSFTGVREASCSTTNISFRSGNSGAGCVFCKTVIDFVLRMVNNDDAVGGYCSFNFQKESPFDFRIIQPADMIRFEKKRSTGDFPPREEWGA